MLVCYTKMVNSLENNQGPMLGIPNTKRDEIGNHEAAALQPLNSSSLPETHSEEVSTWQAEP